MLLEAQDLTCDLLQRSSIRVSFLSSNSFVKILLASLPLTDDDDWDTYVCLLPVVRGLKLHLSLECLSSNLYLRKSLSYWTFFPTKVRGN